MVHARSRIAAASCAALLLLFATLSWAAVSRESPTYDETVHAVAVWTAVKLHDFRINVEHPMLWKYWAGFPQLFTDAFHIDTNAESWSLAPKSRHQQTEVWRVALFATPGNGTEELFDRSRFMMLLLGLGLGAMIGAWAWRLGGALASVVALFFFALDPNFLGHAPLITNDVGMSLVFCALMFAVWRTGQSASASRVAGLALLCGVALTTKYSALACGPIVMLLLLVRAWADRPWVVFGVAVATRAGRIARVMAIGVSCAAVAFVCIWASYGFRYTISSDPGVHMDLQHEVTLEAKFKLIAQHPGVRPTDDQAATVPTGLFMRTMLALAQHRVLPEPYIDGLMYVHANAVIRRTYLLGDVSILGSWAYFPVAMLVKTPSATIVAILLALAMFAAWQPWNSVRARSARAWDAACIAVPPLVYLLMALGANLNLGMRHVFPVYPFFFIGIGLSAARFFALRPRMAGWLTGGVMFALAIESAAAFPNYIAFFNLPAGGARGGLGLLGDSNLDWGQGLKMLRQWQLAHPTKRLGLAYFGSATPEYYGVESVQLSKQAKDGFAFRIVPETDVTAISASMLQGILLDPESQKLMAFVRETQTPTEILGGSIYLYDTAQIFKTSEGVLPE